MFNSILVVCVGNICRSPTGERLLKKYTDSKLIQSAGLAALTGKSADHAASHIAEENGLNLTGHVSRQLTPAICREFDLILVMERKHINAITDLAPEVRGKTMLFGHWSQQRDIPDPYRKSREAFESVYRLLDDSAQQWAQALNIQAGP